MSGSALLISCEHGGNAVPPVLESLFAGWEDLLASHRGYDQGALATAKTLAGAFAAPLCVTTVTRLVVDCNRSLGHRALFSELTGALSRAEKTALLDAYYHPHRQAVTRAVAGLLETGGSVLHLACHSFTPRLAGVTRRCDVGFLYDPARAAEKDFCRTWIRELGMLDRALLLRRNYPYRGVADGLATRLRRRFGERYLGVELEVNQRFAGDGPTTLASLNAQLVESLARALPSRPPSATA
jgi:predicted N-formylglutamate amidohydrolase